MASIDKVVEKMKRQPNGIRIEEADRVLRHYGYDLVHQKGSHRQYRNEQGVKLTVPERKPTIKPCYVDEILKIIKD